MATYAIGDLQGCHSALLKLLNKINFKAGKDTLWFCGDLVNRGPESLAALRHVKKLCEAGDAITVLGNHDLHLLATAHGVRKPSKKDSLASILQAPDREELLHWLRQQPLMHVDKKLNFALVHAGLPPQWTIAQAQNASNEVQHWLSGDNWPSLLQQMYGDQPARWQAGLSEIDRCRYAINVFTRSRYYFNRGEQRGALEFSAKLAPKSEPDNLTPWFDMAAPAWASSRITFGHWSTLPMAPCGPNQAVYPLDHGCVWGGCLSARNLNSPNELISINCQQVSLTS